MSRAATLPKTLRDRQLETILQSSLVLVSGLCFKQLQVNILDSSKPIGSPPITSEPRQPRQPRFAAADNALGVLRSTRLQFAFTCVNNFCTAIVQYTDRHNPAHP